MIKVFDINKNKFLNLAYEKLFVSCGPIGTSKLLVNSFKKIKEIKLRETQHFYTILGGPLPECPKPCFDQF